MRAVFGSGRLQYSFVSMLRSEKGNICVTKGTLFFERKNILGDLHLGYEYFYFLMFYVILCIVKANSKISVP